MRLVGKADQDSAILEIGKRPRRPPVKGYESYLEAEETKAPAVKQAAKRTRGDQAASGDKPAIF